MRRSSILVLLLIALALAACADKGKSTDTIGNYLKAKAAADEEKLVSLSCKAWEPQALLDAVPFKSTQNKIKDISCAETGKDGNYTLVVCKGTLIVGYGGEAPREQNLGSVTYRAIKEDGEWKMCGEHN
jgi:hypothetical protein